MKDVEMTKDFLKGVNDGTVRAVSNEERLWRFLEESRRFREESGVPRSQWRVVNILCEEVDRLHTPFVLMDPDTGRFSVGPGALTMLGFIPVTEGWAP